MAWHIVGTYYAPKMQGRLSLHLRRNREGDQIWCSGGQWIKIDRGDIDGVDVTGTKLAWVADWPKGFLGGEGVGRVYFDPAVSASQRTALEALSKVQRGRLYEVVGQLVQQ